MKCNSKLISLFVLFVALTISVGYKPQTESKDKLSSAALFNYNLVKSLISSNKFNQESINFPIDNGQNNLILNNGNLFVKYKDNVYYRQYSKNNFIDKITFGKSIDYNYKNESPKNMMCLYPDGSKKAVFSDNGIGNIYILNDRMYLQGLKDDNYYIYSVDMIGNNKKDFGIGIIKAADENNNLIICERTNSESEDLFTINTETGEENNLISTKSSLTFLALNDNKIYYMDNNIEWDLERLGQIMICSLNLDGSDKKLIVQTNPDLYEASEADKIDFVSVADIQFDDNYIYFSYGGYSSGKYAGGRIAKVKKDGKNFKILAGNEDTLAGEKFYIINNVSENSLYYNENSKTLCLSLDNGKKKYSDFDLYKINNPFYENNTVNIYKKDSNEKIKLIHKLDYKDLNYDSMEFTNYLGHIYLYNDKTIAEIKNIEIIDNWVYYSIETGINDKSMLYNIREKTNVYRKQIGNNNLENELLFTY